jgi:hypothetical protein
MRFQEVKFGGWPGINGEADVLPLLSAYIIHRTILIHVGRQVSFQYLSNLLSSR